MSFNGDRTNRDNRPQLFHHPGIEIQDGHDALPGNSERLLGDFVTGSGSLVEPCVGSDFPWEALLFVVLIMEQLERKAVRVRHLLREPVTRHLWR